ncbi:DNA polymerase III subunit alpha [Quadrisphaera sp. DSM 44207]|uniref:DNA polymerase III subunit alpha n=1 Tax=Quadrisphaera sp. DSM 44207 TaxID=1881057 RepID=UPI0008904377|nr:PHP domain-containing protein [Quadrisphaera sp. DSM 44207]SDQ53976.1 DNA polymerase III, alpha subunit [Quadrisphaera sp. DSM 44207]
MVQPFPHLHVASGASLRHGTSSPRALVARAADLGLDVLALTDRDGLYGAVKHVAACADAGIAPVLGADLAVEPSGLLGAASGGRGSGQRPPRAAPARGGAVVDPRLPRVTVLAHAGGLGPDGALLPSGAGYGALCRLVSATHLRGRRGRPVTTLGLVGEHAVDPASGAPALTVLLGPASELGCAVLARRTDLARAVLARWYDALPLGCLAVEVVCHGGPPGSPGSVDHAVRTLALAREAGLPAVLTNAVRHADPDGAVTADVLDAARRLVPLSSRELDRTTGQGFLKGTAQMSAVAERVAAAAGAPRPGERGGAGDLLAATHALAARCRLDPARDLGLGSVHLPEPEVLGLAPGTDADAVLRQRCEAAVATRYPGAGERLLRDVRRRLEEELATIAALRYPTYFLTVAQVCDLVRGMGVRVAARGSGAGSLVNHLLGVSGVDPLAHGLLMERFLTTARAQLPDIDLDVESARRTEVYERVIDRFGAERVAAVSVTDTYRVRHAVRDAGAALGMLPSEVDAIAKSFPHVRARDARAALADLPELRASGLDAERLDLLYDLVERLDGLPRHTALHPCGVLLSDATLLSRTPVEASWLGFPMSQYDKDDVEVLGLLKLDVLGIRMQSAMAHAVAEVERVDGVRVDLDDRSRVPLDDEAAFRLVRSTRTLGCFQIESPGQRELIGRFAPQDFADLVVDISLFRPGPVKSDMVTPFLAARQGWAAPDFLHPRLRPALEETGGVVVFHEQVLRIVAETAGVSLTQADEVRRAMGSRDGQAEVEAWWRPLALARGFAPADVDRIWEVLRAFASFGFCKAHAAAFALPTYQSAWLKAHHPAAFLAGVLTHDPGMYPKRLVLDDARTLGIAVLPLDVNASTGAYRVERVDAAHAPPPGASAAEPAELLARWGPLAAGYRLDAAVPDGRGYGIRLSLADVKGISAAEVARVVAGQPYHSLADFWNRARASRPVVERLVVAGAFDALYGIGARAPVRRRGALTRRDLLLQVADLDRHARATASGSRPAGAAARSAAPRAWPSPSRRDLARPDSAGPDVQDHEEVGRDGRSWLGVREAAARQSQAPAPAASEQPVQLALDLGDAPSETTSSGLPEMTGAERVRAELEVLGLDASQHVVEAYEPLLAALGVTRGRDLLRRRSRSDLLVAGVKVATQTPPIRSGRRIVFLTLDDATGPVDATFFEDVQGPFAATVFGSWLLLVRGELRRTGPRGVSLRATGAWELPVVWDVWREGGLDAVQQLLATAAGHDERSVAGAAASRATRPVVALPPLGAPRVLGQDRDDGVLPGADGGRSGPQQHRGAAAAQRTAAAGRAAEQAAEQAAARARRPQPEEVEESRAGGMGGSRSRRVLVHASGFRQSPYADVMPVGGDVRDTRSMAGAAGAGQEPRPEPRPEPDEDAERRARREAPRKVWHSSSGSSGR